MPFDKLSKCIFHSHDEIFKEENRFVEHLLNYIRKCIDSNAEIIFDDIIFSANSTTNIPLFNEITTNKKMKIIGCQFKNNFKLLYSFHIVH